MERLMYEMASRVFEAGNEDTAIRFRGEASIMSNFYPCRVVAHGRVFRSAEHAYQFRKAMFNEDEEGAEYIKEAWSAYIAKRRSYLITKTRTGDEWKAVRVECMKALLMTKFGTSKKLRDCLLASGNVELEEWLPSKEGFWGCGYAGQEGQNMLGKLLMEVRALHRRND